MSGIVWPSRRRVKGPAPWGHTFMRLILNRGASCTVERVTVLSLRKQKAQCYPADVPEQPLYKVVKRQLIRELSAGAWRHGEALPAESRLAERFQVSVGTLRKALDELVAERAVIRQQGRGTFVATHNQSRALFHFFHIVPRIGEKAYPTTRSLTFSRSNANPAEAAKLRIQAGEPIFRIRNLLCLSEEPVIVDDLTIPQRLFPDLSLKILNARKSTIYNLFQTRYGINVLRTVERLRATVADKEVAKLLRMKTNAPLLEIERIALTYHHAPVEIRLSRVNTATYDYLADLGKEIDDGLAELR